MKQTTIHNQRPAKVKAIREMSWTKIRLFAERLNWVDQRGQLHTGLDVPKDALRWDHTPFYIKVVTKKGTVMQGLVACISVDVRRHSRKIKFMESGEIREVYDILIMEIDGVRFFAH